MKHKVEDLLLAEKIREIALRRMQEDQPAGASNNELIAWRDANMGIYANEVMDELELFLSFIQDRLSR